jgi:hypothetical protein
VILVQAISPWLEDRRLTAMNKIFAGADRQIQLAMTGSVRCESRMNASSHRGSPAFTVGEIPLLFLFFELNGITEKVLSPLPLALGAILI